MHKPEYRTPGEDTTVKKGGGDWKVAKIMATPLWTGQDWIFKDFIYLFLDRGKGKEKEKERNINVWFPLTRPLLGTWPATQA